jgi:hypothetical protein
MILGFITRLFGAFRKVSPPVVQQARYIETRGCMGTDYSIHKGIVIGHCVKEVYGSRAPVEFSRIQLQETGEVIEQVRAAAYLAPDGALEWRY